MKRVGFLIQLSLLAMTMVPARASASDSDQRLKWVDEAVLLSTAAEKKVLRIGLLDCIAYTLKNNPDIRIQRIEPLIKEKEVKIAESDFEPALDADFNLYDSKRLSSNSEEYGPAVSTFHLLDFNVGVSGKLTTGTTYSIEYLNERYKSNSSYQEINPYYGVEPKITITQPLLKGFGTAVNRANITIARNDLEASEENLKGTVMEKITETKAAYYAYFGYLRNYAIADLALRRARDLLEINQTRYGKGLVSSVDLLETEAAVAEKEKELLAAESLLKQAEDLLKFVTNIVEDPELWNASLELTDEPEFNVQSVSLVGSLRNAFRHRPDYQSARIDLQNRDILVKTADNDVLPTVDLVGSFGLNGLGEDYQEAVEKLDGDYRNWSVGVVFSLPWGGGDRARYDQRELELAQALIDLRNLEQTIILEVRDRVREVDIQHRQVLASRISYEREQENYKAQQERYAAGQVSTHDLLDYQDKLSQSERDYIKALIEYNIAVITLELSEGLTLAKNDITLKE